MLSVARIVKVRKISLCFYVIIASNSCIRLRIDAEEIDRLKVAHDVHLSWLKATPPLRGWGTQWGHTRGRGAVVAERWGRGGVRWGGVAWSPAWTCVEVLVAVVIVLELVLVPAFRSWSPGGWKGGEGCSCDQGRRRIMRGRRRGGTKRLALGRAPHIPQSFVRICILSA